MSWGFDLGQAERETQQPMRTDTLLRLSSITKPYVSAAALALVARGRLSLEDRVDMWLPEFQPRLDDGASAPDTLRFIECMRKGGAPILPVGLARAAMSNQIGELAGTMPGFGFGYGGAVLLDPQAAQAPQGRGTWLWGGVYGHSWFVDPTAQVSCVLLTNTALEGMIGRLTFDLRNAVYDTLRGVSG